MGKTELYVFLWGFGGSLAVEFILSFKIITGVVKKPERYDKGGYWIARFFLAIFGGVMAYAYYKELGYNNEVLAIHIGATVPTFFDYLFPSLTKPEEAN